MISWFESHFINDDYGNLVEMIDNVPDAISPVKAKPVYIQLSDGDKGMLMQAWRVSVPNSISSTSEQQARYQCGALYEADGISDCTWYPLVFLSRRAASRSPCRGHVVSRFLPVVSTCLTSFTKSPTSPPMFLVIILLSQRWFWWWS
jgi:hypothetical protein